MAFVHRLLDISFLIGSGQYGTGSGTPGAPQPGDFKAGDNVALSSSLRSSARITKAGPPAMSTLQLDIWGMTASQMRQLSTLGMAYQLQRKNSVTIKATNDGPNAGAPATVFQGTIFNAWFDGNAAPETVFHIEAQAGLLEAVQTATPSAYPSDPNATDVLKQLAGKAGLNYEDNGISGVLSSPSYQGSPRVQIQQCATEANVDWVIDNGTLAVWPKNQARKGDVPLISPDSGLVRDPTFTSSGIRFQTIFNTAIVFGGQVKMQVNNPAISPANGTWNVFRIDHVLEANLPGGQWFSTVDAYNPAFPAPVLAGGTQ